MTRAFINSNKYKTIFPNVAKIIKYYFKCLDCKLKYVQFGYQQKNLRQNLTCNK